MSRKFQQLKGKGAGPAPSPTPTPSSTYDTSVGFSVDSNGYADLPLRTGARYIFVGNGGSDAADGLTHATRRATIASAESLVTTGQGDQILIAEGSTFSDVLDRITDKAGHSAAYPLVYQSYNTSDPTNTALYGKATSNRPVFTALEHSMAYGGTTTNYFAIRGLDFNPGNVAAAQVWMIERHDYVLIENNIFRYTQFVYDNGSTGSQAVSVILRRNSIYGAWDTGGRGQGTYIERVNGLTIEDNVFYHNGWKIGASRDDTDANGGASLFAHALYLDNLNSSVTVRRNLIIDPSSHGTQLRAGGNLYDNVYIDCPLPISAGGGEDYNTSSPTGVDFQIYNNTLLGTADIGTADPRGKALESANGRSGSAFHHNMVLRGTGLAGDLKDFVTKADFNQPSYVTFNANLVYLWSASHEEGGAFPAQRFITYSNNTWDAATSGSNTNNSGYSGPNLYTAAQAYVALGYADKAAYVAAAIADPSQNWATNAKSLLGTGYAMTWA